jgi:DNA primase
MLDFFSILQKYDLQKPSISGDELRCCCPLHEDLTPSFSINLETGKYNCFAGCGGGDFIDLISRIEDISREQAREFLYKIEDKEISLNILKSKLENIFKEEKKEKNIILDENILNNFNYDNIDYMTKREFTKETIKKFEIGLCKQGVTIPIRDENNNLVAILVRPVTNEYFLKYFPIMPKIGYKKSLILYGLNHINKDEKEVIIVEGHFDVLKAYQCGFINTVAIQGTNLSEYHMRLIFNRFDKVILALDNDGPGRKAQKIAINKLRNKVSLYKFKYSDSIKDFGDMTLEKIKFGIDNKELIL